jgi:hypothetical protein
MSDHVIKAVPITLEPHTNSDTLSIVRIDGWTCVVKTEQWEGRKFGFYIPPDYVVDTTRAEFAWLNKPGHNPLHRVRVQKLRGIVSAGFLVPAPDDVDLDANHIEALSIKRYEPEHHGLLTGGQSIQGPSFIVPKYDVEDYNNRTKLLTEGEEVVVTEKLHGCVPNQHRIRMADGTMLRMNQIRVGDYVLGQDNNGNTCPSKVLNKFNNGKAEKWLRIKTTRALSGKGNSYCSLTCTPNHKVWLENKKQYMEAEFLEIGDITLSTRTNMEITPLQKQVILGKLLGDGYLAVTNSSAKLVITHKEEHREYLEYTMRCLSFLDNGSRDKRLSGYGSKMRRANSVNSPLLKQEFSSFYKDGTKIVPEWVAARLTPAAIAFWYMDDGSLSHQKDQEDRASFAVCAFTEKDCQVLIQGLQKFDINARYFKSDGYSRLDLKSDDAEKLFLLIAPYITKCMQYKLPERYRGHKPFLFSNKDISYKQIVTTQKVLSIENVTNKIKSMRYDIETETHNYFAGDILVHNCNGRFVFAGGAMFCGSRTEWKREDPTNLWWRALKDNPWIREFCEANPEHVLYGEVLGVQGGFPYGAKGNVPFRAFDVLYKNAYLPFEEAVLLVCLTADCQTTDESRWVPVLYRGPLKVEDARAMAEGQTTIPNATHLREGIVVQPIPDRIHPKYGRIKLKVVGNLYLEKS